MAEFYYKIHENSTILQEQDKLNFKNRICNRINDYYSISKNIQSGDYQKIKEAISHINELHIWPIHAEVIQLIAQDENTYKNNYSTFKSFSDIAYAYNEFLKEKHFVCSKCGMNFTDRNTMTTHEKSHEEKKIYKCDKCGKTFHEERKLQKHIPEHFKCDICGTKFNSEANLTSHKKTKHER